MKHKILIIDDDYAILEALQIMLEDAGYEIRTTAKGNKTMLLVKEYHPDVILLDMLISGHDGREIAKELKSNEDTKQIPIIMLSAHPTAGKSVMEAGADNFLAKPFDIDELLEMVSRYLKK